jgi:hypothetical protein
MEVKYNGKTLTPFGDRQLEALQDIVADGDVELPDDHPATKVDALALPRLLATVQARTAEVERYEMWRSESSEERQLEWRRITKLQDALRQIRDGKVVNYDGRSPERLDWTGPERNKIIAEALEERR